MKIQKIKISKLKNNTGQVEGLPKNPRFIKDDKYKKLIQSLKDDPEMMELREIIAYDNNGELIVICGNMRLRALKELKESEAIVKILPKETPVEKLRAYTIKDNIEYGADDWDLLSNEWDSDELKDWGLDLPDVEDIKNNELKGIDLNESYEVVCECENELEMERLFSKFTNEGIKCRTLIL